MNKDKTVVPHAVGLYVAKFIKPLQRTQKMRKKKNPMYGSLFSYSNTLPQVLAINKAQAHTAFLKSMTSFAADTRTKKKQTKERKKELSPWSFI